MWAYVVSSIGTGENYIKRTFVKNYWGVEIKKNQLGGVCEANCEDEKIRDDLIGDVRVRVIFIVLGLDSSIILKRE